MQNPWKYAAIVLGIVVVLLLLSTVSLSGSEEPKTQSAAMEQSEEVATVQPAQTTVDYADDDATLGDPNAPVTIVEFSDFQCPYCRRHFTQVLPGLRAKYIEAGKVRYIYRDFPLGIHEDAQKAAEAAECARKQGKFWEMHDKIFEGQNKIGAGTVPIPGESLQAYAKELRLDTAAWQTCMDSGEMTAEAQKDMADGIRAGVDRTPTFFINGEKFIGAQPLAAFEQKIEALLAR